MIFVLFKLGELYLHSIVQCNFESKNVMMFFIEVWIIYLCKRDGIRYKHAQDCLGAIQTQVALIYATCLYSGRSNTKGIAFVGLNCVHDHCIE